MSREPLPSSFEPDNQYVRQCLRRPQEHSGTRAGGGKAGEEDRRLTPNSQFREESGLQKFTRRLKEEPLIPLGIFATDYGVYNLS